MLQTPLDPQKHALLEVCLAEPSVWSHTGAAVVEPDVNMLVVLHKLLGE
jgi:hypothetical protein